MSKRIFQIIILSSLFLFLAFSTQAQDVKFYVYPLKLEMPVSPGESLTEEIKILNQGSELLNIRTYVMDYEIDENNEFTFFPPGYESYSAASWITLDKADFTIPAGEEKTLEVTMTIPEETEPGGHFAIIFFESVGSIEQGKSGVVVRGRIGTVILQSSPGEEREEGHIKELKIPKYFFSTPKFFFYGGAQAVPWEMVFGNLGNVHLNIETTIDFLDWQGRSIHKTNPQRITTLPGTDRRLKGEWRDAPVIGKLTAICKVAYGQGKLDTKTISFYIIPVRTLIGLGILLATIVIVIIFVRRYIRRLKTQNAKLHYEVGSAKIKDKKYDEAISQFKKALKFKPDYLEAYQALLKVYRDRKMNKEAMDLEKKVKSLKLKKSKLKTR